MYPTLFKIGDISISSYSVMVMIAYLVAYKLSISEFKRKGLNDNLVDLFFVLTVLGGIGGAKILFLLQNVTFSQFLEDPFRYLASGLTFFGGFIGSILLFVIAARLKKLDIWLITDTVCPTVVLAYAIGRIGCLLVGDDYGIPTDLPWAISFPNGSPSTLERVHPTQIYDTLLMTFVFIFLWSNRKKNLPTGFLSSLTFIILGVERFLIEFIRNTTPSFIPALSQAQLIALGFVFVGLYKIIQLRMKSTKPEEIKV